MNPSPDHAMKLLAVLLIASCGISSRPAAKPPSADYYIAPMRKVAVSFKGKLCEPERSQDNQTDSIATIRRQLGLWNASRSSLQRNFASPAPASNEQPMAPERRALIPGGPLTAQALTSALPSPACHQMAI